MDQLTSKNLQTSRGFIYRYWISKLAEKNVGSPTLLLLHGFNDFASCWRLMIPHLPCRLLIPDLLGHGRTSKPTEPRAYAYHSMVRDMLDILDIEGIKDVIPVGHDCGSVLAQRIYNHAPHRVAALIMLNVAYSPPARTPFNLFFQNERSRQFFGYGCFEYFHFLTSPDAARLMNSNLDRVWDIPHANTFSDMRDLYGFPDAMRRYLSNGTMPRVEIKAYAQDPQLKAEWKAEIQRGGLEGPLCWYTAMVQQVQFESDKRVSARHACVNVPTLFIGCADDAPCRAEMIRPTIEAGLLPHITVHVLEGVGHWPMYEEPKRTADLVVSFLDTRLG